MERVFKEKIAVITGAASGIGFEIADKYLTKGIKLAIILDIDEVLGEESVKSLNMKHGGRAVFLKCDVTTDLDPISKEIFEKYGYVDVLINSAGIFDENSAKKCFAINCVALIEWSMKFHEHMSKNLGGKGGTIINLSSIFGFQITPFLPIYHASKHAVLGFSQSLGHDVNYNKYGVRCIAICPGYTRTPFLGKPKSLRFEEGCSSFSETQEFQDVEAVGQAAVDVFERADSGTAWEVSGGRPIMQVRSGIIITLP